MSLVVDASSVLSLALPDEAGGEERSQWILRGLCMEGITVPAQWPVEVAGGLLRAERRGRCGGAFVSATLDLLAQLPVTLRPVVPGDWERLVALARDQGLSVHDACYLDVALRERLALVTLDTALSAAAERLKVPLYGG